MGIEVNPLASFSLTSGESSAAIEAGMAVMLDTDGTALKATAAGFKFAGVAKFEAAAGEAVTVQHGLVNVQVTGTGSAGNALEISATAGLFGATTTATDLIVGYALETWTTAGTVKAFIYPAPTREAIA